MNIKSFITILYILLASGNLLALEGITIKDHALPKSSIRAKLDAIFQDSRDLAKLQQDPTWYDYKSYHWLVGSLSTASGHKYMVKGQIIDPGTAIYLPGIPTPFVHDPQQNLSRIAQSQRGKKAIKEQNLKHFKVQGIWAYPLSGNDEDLTNQTTDKDVLIIEEWVEGDETLATCPVQRAKVQKAILNLNEAQFDELKKLTDEYHVLDLHTKNLKADNSGNLYNLDWENLAMEKGRKVDETFILTRPFARYELEQMNRAGSIDALTLLARAQSDPKLQEQAQQLANRIDPIINNRFMPRRTAQIVAGCAAAGVMIRYGFYIDNIQTLIRNCRQEIELHLTQLDTVNDQVIIDTTKEVMRRNAPKENRQTIIDAFITISLAEGHYDAHKVTILGKEYASSQDAIDSSIKYIEETWQSDKLLIHKAAHGIKNLGSRVKKLFTTSQPVAA